MAALSERLGGTGQIAVEPTLQVEGHPNIWALGDCATIPDPVRPGRSYPPTAQHALREGRLVATNVAAVIGGEQLSRNEVEAERVERRREQIRLGAGAVGADRDVCGHRAAAAGAVM